MEKLYTIEIEPYLHDSELYKKITDQNLSYIMIPTGLLEMSFSMGFDFKTKNKLRLFLDTCKYWKLNILTKDIIETVIVNSCFSGINFDYVNIFDDYINDLPFIDQLKHLVNHIFTYKYNDGYNHSYTNYLNECALKGYKDLLKHYLSLKGYKDLLKHYLSCPNHIYYADTYDDSDMIYYCALGNNLDCMKLLLDSKYKFKYDEEKTMCVAVKNNNFEMVKYLQSKNCSFDKYVCQDAFEEGNLDMLKYLLENDVKIAFGYYDPNKEYDEIFEKQIILEDSVFKHGYKNRQFECLILLLENGCYLDIDNLISAAINNDIGQLQSFYELRFKYQNHLEYRIFEETIPINSENLEFSDDSSESEDEEENISLYDPWHTDVTDNAAAYGNLESLKFAIDNGCSLSENVCSYAIKNGNYECLEYLLENDAIITKRAIIHAVKMKDYCYVKSLYQHFIEHISSRREEDQLELVSKYFNQKSRVFESAAELGDLDMMKYLISLNKNMKISQNAYYKMAENGHIDCLEYFYGENAKMEQANNGVSIVYPPWNNNVLSAAASGGNLQCFQKLIYYAALTHHNIDTSDAAEYAALNGHFNIIEYICKNDLGWDERVFVNARKNYHSNASSRNIFWYALRHRCPGWFWQILY